MAVIDEPRKAFLPTRLLMRLPVPWVFMLAYLAGVELQRLAPVGIGRPGVALTVKAAGAALLGLGAGLAAWGLFAFFRARTTTTPGNAPAKLVTGGPYRFTRNPMYVGLTLAYLGEAGILVQIWPLLPLLLVLAYLSATVIPVEEASLRSFGEEYAQYCRRVRRWI
jgi:protein-S-isoprenylcysteine O-methyltransferase Ste14